MQVVKKADLGRLDLDLNLIAHGAYGVVFRVDEFTLTGDATPLAYKEFTRDHEMQESSAKAAVIFREGQTSDERVELDEFSAWPRALVEDDAGKICGLLMPLIPEPFFCQFIDYKTNSLTFKPREMKWLIAGRETRDAAQIDLVEIGHAERLFLMAKLVYAIGWLHKRSWVFGDLSFRNVTFALDPPRLMLLDCDGAAALDNQHREQSSTLFWDPPECPITPQGGQPGLQDRVTDVYKLGLAILRCLTPGKGTSSSRSVARLSDEEEILDAEGIALVSRILSEDRGVRPTAKEIYAYLRKVISPLLAIPEVRSVTLVTPFRLRGQDVRIDWHLLGAANVTIRVGDDFHQLFNNASNTYGCSFTPPTSGPVSIVANNSYGSVTVDLGELTLYELPPFNVDLSNLPVPQIPEIEAFSADQFAARFTGISGLEIEIPTVPEVSSPWGFDFGEDPTPDLSLTLSGPRVDETIIDVSNTIGSLILESGADYIAALQQTILENTDG